MKSALNTHRTLLLAASLCLALCAARSASAQASSGGGFVLAPQVVAGGGGSSAGGAFTIAGTVAQHDAATSAGGAFTLEGGFWAALGPDAPPTPSCATDVTALLNVTRGGFSLNLVTHLYRQTVTVRNLGAAPVDGPLAYVLDGLTPGVSLINPSGVTACAGPAGSPYVLVPTGGGQLAPGESVSLLLEYAVYGTTRSINYNARLLSGAAR